MHLELSPDLGATWVAAACDANGKLQTAGAGGGGGLSVTAGAAVGTLVTPVGGSDGTNAQFLHTDTSGNLFAVGNVASAVADSGNPVKVGGVANSGVPTAVTVGQRVNLWLDTSGGTVVAFRSGQVGVGDGISVAQVATWADHAGGTQRLPAITQYVYDGADMKRVRMASVFKSVAAVAITAGTGATIWTPAAGKKFRLMGWSLSSSVAASMIFGDNAVGTVILRTELTAAAGVAQSPPGLGNGFLSAAANNVLKLDVSASGTVSGFVFGCEE